MQAILEGPRDRFSSARASVEAVVDGVNLGLGASTGRLHTSVRVIPCQEAANLNKRVPQRANLLEIARFL